MARKREETPPLPVVGVAPLGALKAYTVSEHEMDRTATGSVISDLLTIGYALLSVALTLLATLLSTSLPDLHFVIFVCALLIFALGGGICVFIGWRTRESVQALVTEIKNRMPPPPAIREILVQQLTVSQTSVVERPESEAPRPSPQGPPPPA